MKTTVIMLLLLAVPPTYMVARATGFWSGENLSNLFVISNNGSTKNIIFNNITFFHVFYIKSNI